MRVEAMMHWYKFQFTYGPGHQSSFTTYAWSEKPMSPEELDDTCETFAYWHREIDPCGDGWVCHPEVVDKPPQEWTDHQVHKAKLDLVRSVAQLRFHGASEKVWAAFPKDFRMWIDKLANAKLPELRAKVHRNSSFTTDNIRRWKRGDLVLYLIDWWLEREWTREGK